MDELNQYVLELTSEVERLREVNRRLVEAAQLALQGSYWADNPEGVEALQDALAFAKENQTC